MALILGDGFDHYATANLLQKWDGKFADTSGGGGVTVSTSYGRLGSQGVRINGGSPGLLKNIYAANSSFGYVGAAVYVPSYAIGGFLRQIFAFYDSPSGGEHISLWIENNGALSLRYSLFPNGFSATYDVTQPGLLAAATWYYIEMKYKVGGSIQVRVNEALVPWIGSGTTTYSGNTSPGPGTAAYFTQIGLGGGDGNTVGGWGSLYLDDFYYCDDTGAQNNSFLGDVHLGVIYPDGAGTSAVWTPQGAANNWDCVNEMPPDDATTYVWSPTVGDIDLYTMQDTATTVSGIKGLLMNARVMKDDATARSYATLVKPSGGATAEVATRTTPYGAFVNQQDVSELNPTTGLAWTKAQVDAMEAGLKVKV